MKPWREINMNNISLLWRKHPGGLPSARWHLKTFLGLWRSRDEPLRMRGSDYRFNFPVSGRRLRVADIIHSDKVSHLQRPSAVGVIHRPAEMVWLISGKDTKTQWPFLKWNTWMNVEMWEINRNASAVKTSSEMNDRHLKTSNFSLLNEIWWIGGLGFNRLFLLPESSSSDRNRFPRQGEKNTNQGFYKDNTVRGKCVLYSDVWLYYTHGIKTCSNLTEGQDRLGSLVVVKWTKVNVLNITDPLCLI